MIKPNKIAKKLSFFLAMIILATSVLAVGAAAANPVVSDITWDKTKGNVTFTASVYDPDNDVQKVEFWFKPEINSWFTEEWDEWVPVGVDKVDSVAHAENGGEVLLTSGRRVWMFYDSTWHQLYWNDVLPVEWNKVDALTYNWENGILVAANERSVWYKDNSGWHQAFWNDYFPSELNKLDSLAYDPSTKELIITSGHYVAYRDTGSGWGEGWHAAQWEDVFVNGMERVDAMAYRAPEDVAMAYYNKNKSLMRHIRESERVWVKDATDYTRPYQTIEDFSLFNGGLLVRADAYDQEENKGQRTESLVIDNFAEDEENSPPYTPSNPSPANGATNVNINVGVLIWNGGDPDSGDTVKYKVTFDGNVRCDWQSQTSCAIPQLEKGKTYQWNVVARDNHGAVTNGPAWAFTAQEEGGEENNPPVVYDIYGYNEGGANSGDITFIANAADIDGDAVTQVIFDVSYTGQWWFRLCTDNDPSDGFRCVWDSTLNISGYDNNVQVRAKAYDNQDWGDFRVEGPFSVDNREQENNPPVIYDIYGYNEGGRNYGEITFYANASDPDQGDEVESVIFYVTLNGQWKAICTDSDGSDGFKCVWDSTEDIPAHKDNVLVAAAANDGELGTWYDEGPFSVWNTPASWLERGPFPLLFPYLLQEQKQGPFSVLFPYLLQEQGRDGAPLVTDIYGYEEGASRQGNSGIINFHAVAYDPDAGDAVEKVWFQVSYSSSLQRWKTVCIDDTTRDGWNCEWDSEEDIPGNDNNVFVRAKAYDGELWGAWYEEGPFSVLNGESTTLYVEILTPEVDEVISGVYDVTWIARDLSSISRDLNIKIEYSYDGYNWFVLEDGQHNNDGVFAWDTTALSNADDYKLKITARNSIGEEAFDVVDPFTVRNGFAPIVIIHAPKEGDVWYGTRDILWTATDPDEISNSLDILIEFTYNGHDWFVLEKGPDNNDGVFTWDTTKTEDSDDYKLRIIATDEDGNTGTAYVPQFSINNRPFSVELEASPLSGEAPLKVEFTAVVEGGSLPYRYTWDFGDGKTSASSGISSNSATHTYQKEGKYTAEVTIVDRAGKTAKDSIEITVKPKEKEKPRDKMQISRLSFLNDDELQPGDELVAVVNLENTGNTKMEKVKITIAVWDLAVKRSAGPFELDAGEETSKRIMLEIPADAEPGVYDIEVVVSGDKSSGEKVFRRKFREIKVI